MRPGAAIGRRSATRGLLVQGLDQGGIWSWRVIVCMSCRPDYRSILLAARPVPFSSASTLAWPPAGRPFGRAPPRARQRLRVSAAYRLHFGRSLQADVAAARLGGRPARCTAARWWAVSW